MAGPVDLLNELERRRAAQQKPTPEVMTPPTSPMRTEGVELDIEGKKQDIPIKAAREGREATEFEAKQDIYAPSKGLPPTEGERTAGYLTQRMEGHVNNILDLYKKDPEVIKPSWLETISSQFGDIPRDLALKYGGEADRVADRQIILQRYGDIIDAALTLGTGAAYNQEQLIAQRKLYMPTVTDEPATIRDKMGRLKEVLLAGRTKTGASVPYIDAALSSIDKLIQASDYQTDKPQGPANIAEIGTENKEEDVPKEVQLRVINSLLKVNRGELTTEKLQNILKENAQPWVPAMSEEELKAYVDNYNNPESEMGQKFKVQKPSSAIENVIGSAFQVPYVGPAAAQSANAFTLGIPSLLGAKPGLEQLREDSPYSSFAGDLLGSVIGTKGLGLAKGAAFGRSARPAMDDITADLFQAATRGATEADEGERTKGAVFGIATALAGQGAGQLAGAGTRRFLKPETQQAIDRMVQEKVKMTPAQGGGWGGAEGTFTNWPLAHGRRKEAVNTWNKAFKNRVLTSIGVEPIAGDIKPGQEFNDRVISRINTEFKELEREISGQVGPDFVQTVLSAVNKDRYTGPQKDYAEKLLTVITNTIDGDLNYTGKSMREGVSDLGKYIRRWGKKQDDPLKEAAAQEMAEVASDLRDALYARLEMNDPATAERFFNLSDAYSRISLIKEAADANPDARGIVTPEMLNRIIGRSHRRVGSSKFARGEAKFQDEINEALDILGRSPNDTANAWATLGTGATVAGGMAVNPAITAAQGGVASMYMPITRDIWSAALNKKRPLADVGGKIFGQDVKAEDAYPLIISQALQSYIRDRRAQ